MRLAVRSREGMLNEGEVVTQRDAAMSDGRRLQSERAGSGKLSIGVGVEEEEEEEDRGRWSSMRRQKDGGEGRGWGWGCVIDGGVEA